MTAPLHSGPGSLANLDQALQQSAKPIGSRDNHQNHFIQQANQSCPISDRILGACSGPEARDDVTAKFRQFKFASRAVLTNAPHLCVFSSSSFIPYTSSLSDAQRSGRMSFIYADDLGWGSLSCYGQTNYETPHLTAWPPKGHG